MLSFWKYLILNITCYWGFFKVFFIFTWHFYFR